MATSSERIHVVAAAIVDGDKVLVARRPDDAHQGGLWEFPGGKLEPGETPEIALVRELEEELDIEASGFRRLIRVPHDYDDAKVLLDVWWVNTWKGVPQGKEGQFVEWRPIKQLRPADFPAANRSIITAVQLPALYLITPEPATTPYLGLRLLQDRLREGRVSLVQLRSKRLEEPAYRMLIRQVAAMCVTYGAKVLVNADPKLAVETEAMGVHLTSQRLMRCAERPLDKNHLVAASCHCPEQLGHASRIGVDFAVLSPVAETTSHPDVSPLGWAAFRELVEMTDIPVYALGGMRLNDIDTAWEHGGQGIATISGLD